MSSNPESVDNTDYEKCLHDHKHEDCNVDNEYEHFISEDSKWSSFDEDLSTSYYLEGLIAIASNEIDRTFHEMLTLANKKLLVLTLRNLSRLRVGNYPQKIAFCVSSADVKYFWSSFFKIFIFWLLKNFFEHLIRPSNFSHFFRLVLCFIYDWYCPMALILHKNFLSWERRPWN